MDSPLSQDFGYASVASFPFRGTPVSTGDEIARIVPSRFRTGGNATRRMTTEIDSATTPRAMRATRFGHRVAHTTRCQRATTCTKHLCLQAFLSITQGALRYARWASHLCARATKNPSLNFVCRVDDPEFWLRREIAIAVRSAKTRGAHDGRKCQILVDLSKTIRETGTNSRCTR